MKITSVGASFAAAAVLFGGFAGPAQSAQPSVAPAAKKYSTLVINQGAPKLTTSTITVGTDTESFVIFTAPLTNAKGQKFGEIVGNLTVLDVGGQQATSETRFREISYLLPGGQLVANGASEYLGNEIELQINKPVTIAIVGGTGKYLGARGEVTTRRNADGTYRHVIKLLK